MSIGLFDSGSGGLTILEGLRSAMPDRDFLYFGDHANAPYGHRDNAQIVEMTKHSVDLLFREGATLVILACNTAAAIALRHLQQNWLEEAWPGRRILGVLVPMVEAVTGLPWHAAAPVATPSPRQAIGLFATRKTIESRAYHDEVAKRAPHVSLIDKPCPGLVDAIEGGAGLSPLKGLVSGYVQELLEVTPRPDAVILGCTHFPLVGDMFKAALPEGTPIYSQPGLVADSLADYLSRHPDLVDKGKGRITCWTSSAALDGTAPKLMPGIRFIHRPPT